MEMVQLAPAATLEPQLSLSEKLVEEALPHPEIPQEYAPEMAMELKSSGTTPELVKTIDCGALEVPVT
jgi:hypothetical protein